MFLQTQGIAKDFGKLRAVNEVTLEIQKGDTHAIIGPNGAGKSTYFNLITGIIEQPLERSYSKGRRLPICPLIIDVSSASPDPSRSPVSIRNSAFMKVY